MEYLRNGFDANAGSRINHESDTKICCIIVEFELELEGEMSEYKEFYLNEIETGDTRYSQIQIQIRSYRKQRTI